MDFIASHIGTILALVGSFGVVAIIGLCLLVGVPLLSIVASAVGTIKQAFRFFSTPLGQVVVVIGLCVLVWFVTDMRVRRQEIAACRAADIKAELQAAQRDIDMQKSAAAQADKTALELRSYSAGLETRVKDYEAEIAKRPVADACRATDDDVRRLRDFAQ